MIKFSACLPLVLSTAILFGTTNCSWFSGSAGSNTPIKIGFLGSLTGGTATFAKSTLMGVELAFEEAKSQGLKVELLVKDSKGNAEESMNHMKSLAEDASVVAVLGEISSSMSLAVAPVAQQFKLPMVTPTSTNPRVTEVGDYIFRICFVDPFQGFVMAKFALEHLKITKVAVLKDRKSDYSKGLAKYFTDTFKEKGGEIVKDEVYDTGDRDFKVQLQQIRSQKPEAIFIPGYYKEVALIARQARQMGIEAQLLGGDGWDSTKLFELGKEAINGGYFSNHFTAESKEESAKVFTKAFRNKFQQNPDGLAARGYDAAKILLAAVEKSPHRSRSEIQQFLGAIKDFPGATGTTSMTPNRNAKKSAVVLKVNGPINTFVTSIAP